jgi:hypothetical protein
MNQLDSANQPSSRQIGESEARSLVRHSQGAASTSAAAEPSGVAARQTGVLRTPTTIDARNAAIEFLRTCLPEVHAADVTRVIRRPERNGAWEVEAEVWRASLAIQALGLPTNRPVLDRQEYIVRMDAQLNVLEYGIRELMQEDR